MNIKSQFELIYGRQGLQVHNVVPLGKSTLSAFQIPDEDTMYIKNLVKMHIRSKQEIGKDIVLDNLDLCKLVKMADYPLPGFCSKEGIGYINLSSLPSDDPSDYSPTDMYALYLYSTALTLFITKKAIPEGIEGAVASFLFAIFMKLFRKKSGLAGARELVPKLAFLIAVYNHSGMFGFEDTDRDRRKIASSLYTNFDDLKMDYDFTSTVQFLQAINDNHIISISANKFSTEIINRGDIVSLPIFEDTSRFFSSILASTIPGTRIFPNYWSKIHPNLFTTLVNKGMMFLGRAK